MQVIWQTFLKALDVKVDDSDIRTPRKCPVCRRCNRTLRVTLTEHTGAPFFTCGHPKCGFKGDAIALAQAVHKLDTLEQAAELFKPGQIYDTTRPINAPDHQWQDYVKKAQTETELTAFITRCRNKARTITSLELRYTLATLGCHGIPAAVGIHVHNARTFSPPSFIPNPKRRPSGIYAIYPYTYNGKLTGVEFQHINKIPTWTSPESHFLTPTPSGVFMEDNAKMPANEIYFVTKALGACLIQTQCGIRTLKQIPVISAPAFPLPISMIHINRVNILVFNQSPLTFKHGLELYNNHTLEDLTDRPIRVIDLKLDARDLPIELYSTLQTNNYYSEPLTEWLITTMRHLETEGKQAVIKEAFSTIKLTEPRKEQLLIKARELKLSDALIDIVGSNYSQDSTPPVAPPVTPPVEVIPEPVPEPPPEPELKRITLANGRIIVVTPTSLKAVQDNKLMVLCNFNITVQARVTDNKNRSGYKCKITTGTNTFSVGIRALDCASAARLADTVNAGLTTAGISEYLTVYQLKGYDWRDILACLSQDIPGPDSTCTQK